MTIKIDKVKLLIVAVVVIAIIIAFSVFHFECPICKQTKWSVPHKIEYFGIEYKVCGKCYDVMGPLYEDLDKATKDFSKALSDLNGR